MPLHYASLVNAVDCARLLCRNGALINAKDCSDNTPLHLAVYKNHLEMV
jgi:ankyrin repeat protein